MTDPDPGISVVVPVHNEEETLPELRMRLVRSLEAAGVGFEILLVDDGSTDRSGSMMDAFAAADGRIRVLHLRPRNGQSGAFDAGFRAARRPIVVTIDADLQNDPADIPSILEPIRAGRADVVCGVRTLRHDSWIRLASSRIANRFRDWITGDRITDTGCSLKVYRTEYLRRVKMYKGMHRFLPTLLRLEGARVIEMPVSHHARAAGRSKYGVGNRLFVGIRDCFAVRWMRDRTLRYTVESPELAQTALDAEAPEHPGER